MRKTGSRSNVYRQHGNARGAPRSGGLLYLRQFWQRSSRTRRGHRRSASTWAADSCRCDLPERNGRDELRPRIRAVDRSRPGSRRACRLRDAVAWRRCAQCGPGAYPDVRLCGHVAVLAGGRGERQPQRIHPLASGRPRSARHRPAIYEIRQRNPLRAQRQADRASFAANRPQRPQRTGLCCRRSRDDGAGNSERCNRGCGLVAHRAHAAWRISRR